MSVAPPPAPTPPPLRPRAQPAAPKTQRASGPRVPLGDSGWSVLPPKGIRQLWINRPAPGRTATLQWGSHDNRGGARVVLTFGDAGRFDNTRGTYGRLYLDPCAHLPAQSIRAAHAGHPIIACSNPSAGRKAGTGRDDFILTDSSLMIQVRYQYPTQRREEMLRIYHGVCDSLQKDQ